MALQLFSGDYIIIDIGFRNIKILQVKKKKSNELTIVNYGIGDTPPGCIRNGAISNKELVLSVIRKIMSEHKLRSKEAKIIISGTNIITRIIMIDRIDEIGNEKRIWDEIHSYLPINMSEYRVDYKILDTVSDGNSEKLKVFITAVSKTIIDSYVEILKSLDLKPISVDIPANSVSKFFQREIMHAVPDNWSRKQWENKHSTKTIAVIDMGSETTIINILRDRIPEFNRVILRGGSNIDAAIMTKLELEPHQTDQAERYKKAYGILPAEDSSNETALKCNEAVKTCIDEVIRYINASFDFYVNKCAGEGISKIYLIGGGSQLKGLRNYLENSLHIPVYPINLVNIDGIAFSQGLNKDKVNFLINAIGVAL